MSATEPSPGEIMRRLDEVSRQLIALAGDLRADRIDAAATYVRKDLYQSETTTIRADIEGLQESERERDKRAAETRRQLIVGVCVAVSAALISLLVTLVLNAPPGGL